MLDLTKNPYLINGEVVVGKEIEHLKWNQETLNKNNPYKDHSTGYPFADKFVEYANYMEKIAQQYDKDFALLPKKIQKQISDNKRMIQSRIKAESGS